MAHDFEDIHDIDSLSDDELRDLVRSRLAESNAIDSDDISVQVDSGRVKLSGRVGTEAELRIADHIVTDSLGIVELENEIVIDAIRRADSPEAIDDHDAAEEASEGLLLGDRAVPLSPEAEHLEEDLDGRLFGTTDVGKSTAEGMAWIPPESPTPEGLSGTDAGPGAMGEDH
jgi:hypothetical protein